ncbi:hypothetical protein PACTADRAFT_49522 [Pachysolen tannophilus NRRL Y-2460]|uniref:2-hydroxyacyl-CoA lyase n=1 Tax=Pachysolen tannophilus NRRL Y-2460 TaxID=669874 RepID=A0A1E4TWR2_PACTA|nr:hypothetical protein PACTADRAFT_49522 [Pachysolen tannophilus NRRL Y-2460]
MDQVSLLKPYVKFSTRPRSIQALPQLVEKALKDCLVGVPGVTYVDLPGDMIQMKVDADEDVHEDVLVALKDISCSEVLETGAPKFLPEPSALYRACKLIKSAKFPLIVLGKGAAYSDCPEILRSFITSHNLAFLPTPMGKGIMCDYSQLNVSSCRSAALKNADVIILVGARLNWILHFGESPRFNEDVKFIQLDLSSEDIGNNGSLTSYKYGLVGDIGLTIEALDKLLKGYNAPSLPGTLKDIIKSNESKLAKREEYFSTSSLLNYFQVYKILKDIITPIEDDIIYVIEGANTMDYARQCFPATMPKQRLDAGTNATMGVGLGYAIAAKISHPKKLVLAIEGDSAFGFSAMELETIRRANLPVLIVVMNNSGIYHGIKPERYLSNDDNQNLPSTALGYNVRYDLLAKSFGITGYYCDTYGNIKQSFTKAVDNYYKKGESSLLNIIIDPAVDTKLQFGWQSGGTKKKKSTNTSSPKL